MQIRPDPSNNKTLASLGLTVTLIFSSLQFLSYLTFKHQGLILIMIIIIIIIIVMKLTVIALSPISTTVICGLLNRLP